MCSVGRGFSHYVITSQFIFSLSGAEKVGSKFRATHMVKNVLIFLQTFTSVYIILVQSAIKSFISGVLENAVIFVRHDSGIFGGACEARVMFLHFSS